MNIARQEYKYQSPLERGYTQLRLTNAQHNAIFKYRKYDLRRKTEYFYNGHHFIAHHFTRLWWVALICVPAFIIGTFVDGLPSTWRDMKRAFRPKHYGSFTGDSASFTPEKYWTEYQPVIDSWLRQHEGQKTLGHDVDNGK